MAAGRPLAFVPRHFDDAKLQSMIEPLTVRIERMTGGRRQPIPMWTSAAGEEGGKGFTKDEIRELETALVTQWAGGGTYELSVTDSSPEGAITLRWTASWDPRTYPELVPPPLQEAISPEAAASVASGVQNKPQQGFRMPLYPQPLYQPQTQYQGPQQGYPLPPPPAISSPHYGLWTAEVDRRERDDELRRLRVDNERREREAREAAHKADLERERNANNDRFGRLEAALANLASSLKEAAQPRGPSAEVQQLQAELAAQRDQLRRAEEKTEAARREQEAERRESQLREQIRQQGEQAQRGYEQTQRQIEQMNQQFQQTIANLTTQLANSANKQDPLITLMIENARANSEALKEVARENRAAIERVQAFAMNPRELVELAKSSQDGIEKAVDRTTRLTNDVLGMQNRVLETALQTQPGGPGIIDAVTQGMNNVKEFLERFVGGKSKEAIAAAQANAEVAKAQAHVIEVQARMTNPAAFGAAPALNGAPPQPAAFTPPPPPPPSAVPTPSADPTKQPRVERLWGRTDEEWFGPALPDVLRLRVDVETFSTNARKLYDAGKIPDKIEDIPGANPPGVAVGILMATAEAQNRGMTIPAMVELLVPGMLKEFTMVLLPDATQQYRDELVTALTNVSGTQAEEEKEDEDDEGEDGEDGEDVKSESVAPQPPTKEPTGPRRGGRRGHG